MPEEATHRHELNDRHIIFYMINTYIYMCIYVYVYMYHLESTACSTPRLEIGSVKLDSDLLPNFHMHEQRRFVRLFAG